MIDVEERTREESTWHNFPVSGLTEAGRAILVCPALG